MAQNFIGCDRDQSFLMPPDVRDWLPAGHLAWFVLDAVAGMDLRAFYGRYREDGVGRRAYDPAMMVALLLYAYSRGVRSARSIERACEEDVAFRVIAMLESPDHATIARFVVRHEAALGELFGQVLRLCDQAGLVRPGLVAVDGTRLPGNASRIANRDFQEIAREVIADAKAIDQAEDGEHGEARGDELPEQLHTREGRREFFRRAREQVAADPEVQHGTDNEDPAADSDPVEFELSREVLIGRRQGRDAWTREARRQVERRRWEDPDPIPRDRADRLRLAAERLDSDLDADLAANAAYDHFRATGRDSHGRRLSRPPNPYIPPVMPDGTVNVSDPDSKVIKAGMGTVQGFNAQAVVGEGHIVLAAEITNSTVDFSQLSPMITAAIAELQDAGATARPGVAVADSQYWNEEHMDHVISEHGVQVLIPPDSGRRKKPRPGWTGGRYDWMRTVLREGPGRDLYRQRQTMVEPVFAHTKHNRKFTRFARRGRTAVRTEWRLMMATHNLTSLHRHQTVLAAA